jgi:hypothetical protein
MMVVRKGGRLITLWFMESSFGKLPKHRDQYPRLCDLASKERSPVTAIMQNLSALAAGNAEMLRLIWQETDLDGMEEWRDIYATDRAIALRRAIFSVAAWNHRRHGIYTKLPFSLAGAIDGRLPRSSRMAPVNDLLGKSPCCIEPGVARDLAERRVGVDERPLSVDDFEAPPLQLSILCFATTVTLSLCDTERKHARGRRWVQDGSSFQQFAAEYCNIEARELFKARTMVAEKKELVSSSDAVPQKVSAKAQSPLEVYRSMYLNRERTAGHELNPVNTDVWDRQRQCNVFFEPRQLRNSDVGRCRC